MTLSVHVEQMGAGSDLVLVHGWGLNGGVWTALAERLARHFRIWIIDLPGHGASSSVATPSTLAALAHTLLEVAPLRATWMGWSLGAMATLEVARQAPTRCARLVLVAATPRFVTASDWPWAMAPAALDELAREIDADRERALTRFAALQFGNGDIERAALRVMRAELFRRGVPSQVALQAGLDILTSADLRAALPAVTAPSLIMQGADDRLVPQAAAEYLARTLPKATLHCFDGAGHAPFLSCPQAFADRVEEFLHE